MKKLLSLLCVLGLAVGCTQAVREAKNAINCKYALRSVEVAEYNVSSLSFDIYIGITNMDRKDAAAIKRFEGKIYMNDDYISDVKFEDVRIEPNTTKNQKVTITVPTVAFSKKLLGLVSMGSGTVDYHLTGTMYFDTPLGEVPVPVDIGRIGSYN